MLADASMLNKMSPFFAVLFSFLILKEKVASAQVFIILGAFFGSMFVVKPTFLNLAFIPSLIGLAGGICAGLGLYDGEEAGGRAGKKARLSSFFSRRFPAL